MRLVNSFTMKVYNYYAMLHNNISEHASERSMKTRIVIDQLACIIYSYIIIVCS